MRKRVSTVLLLLGALSAPRLVAQDSGVTVRDSAGVRIVESRAPLWAAGAEWKLAPEPTLTVGGPNAPAEQTIDHVSSMRRLRDGTVLLGSHEHQLRWYDPRGQLTRKLDRFQTITSIHVFRGDSIGIADSGQKRFIILTAAADTVRAHPLSGIDGRPAPVGVLADGSVVGFVSPALPQSGVTGPYRPEFTLVHWDTNGVGAYLFEYPGQERFAVFADGGVLYAAQPFFRSSIVATRGQELLIALTEAPGFTAYAINGAPRLIARRSFEPRPVTDQDIAEWRETARAAIARSANSSRLQIRFDVVQFPATHPALDSRGPLIADVEGNVWVPMSLPGDATNPTQFTVYRADGRWLGNVQVPQRFRPLDIGADYVAGVLTNEGGVESAQVYALRKP
jgi:hypothetical protein